MKDKKVLTKSKKEKMEKLRNIPAPVLAGIFGLALFVSLYWLGNHAIRMERIIDERIYSSLSREDPFNLVDFPGLTREVKLEISDEKSEIYLEILKEIRKQAGDSIIVSTEKNGNPSVFLRKTLKTQSSIFYAYLCPNWMEDGTSIISFELVDGNRFEYYDFFYDHNTKRGYLGKLSYRKTNDGEFLGFYSSPLHFFVQRDFDELFSQLNQKVSL